MGEAAVPRKILFFLFFFIFFFQFYWGLLEDCQPTPGSKGEELVTGEGQEEVHGMNTVFSSLGPHS